ncbi:MAG: Uncharacterised protein [Acidimicrobiales bacterium AG-410-I20]|nr:MAG: Uncharacterised protein [Acidimicrobiales bacterium AG-410-I20]
MNRDLDHLLELGDLDELIRLIDQLCKDRSWSVLEDVAIRSRQANERGQQLWPAGDHAEHRLALEAPGEFAARAVNRDAQIFGLAPLTEVAASSHTWEDLNLHLNAGPLRSLVIHERVVRGEDLTGIEITEDPLGIPLALTGWEKSIETPDIKEYEVNDSSPSINGLDYFPLPKPDVVTHDAGTQALRSLVQTWTSQSNGRSAAVRVYGDAATAISSLGVTEAKAKEVSISEIWNHMVWAASSGGAYGRRPGCAKGRFEAWWCAVALAGLDQEEIWPPFTHELGDALTEMNWWIWNHDSLTKGWNLRIAVEDPIDGLSWALSAEDTRE